MEHVLDNPAWSALISGNKHLANGNTDVKYFDKEVSPYVAFNKNSPQKFNSLFDMLPHGGPILFVAPVETEIPAQWKLLQYIPGLQMVYQGGKALSKVEIKPVRLTDEHIPQMLDLTKLTKPGPFDTRTIDFGHYEGIMVDDTGSYGRPALTRF